MLPHIDACCYASTDLSKFSEDVTQGVNGVSAWDGHRVGAIRADPLPDATVSSFGDRTDHNAKVYGYDVADFVIGNDVTRKHHSRVTLCLKPYQSLHSGRFSAIGHFCRVREIGAQWPLAAHWFLGVDRSQNQLLVQRYTDNYCDEINI